MHSELFKCDGCEIEQRNLTDNSGILSCFVYELSPLKKCVLEMQYNTKLFPVCNTDTIDFVICGDGDGGDVNDKSIDYAIRAKILEFSLKNESIVLSAGGMICKLYMSPTLLGVSMDKVTHFTIYFRINKELN